MRKVDTIIIFIELYMNFNMHFILPTFLFGGYSRKQPLFLAVEGKKNMHVMSETCSSKSHTCRKSTILGYFSVGKVQLPMNIYVVKCNAYK